jgi:hypothetical protein
MVEMQLAQGRFVAAGLAFLVLVGTCGEDGGGAAEYRAFAAEYAQAVCQRIFGCCSAAERGMTLAFNYPDMAACLRVQEDGVLRTESGIEQGQWRFDPKDGQRCLAQLQAGTCGALFSRRGSILGCRDVLRGWAPLGAACDNTDIICQSNWCQDDVCAPPPPCKRPVDCGAGQFCNATGDPATQICQPARARGEACGFNDDECGTGRCRQRVCVDGMPDGQRCQFESDCTGFCDNVLTNTPEGSCRPALCQGSAP